MSDINQQLVIQIIKSTNYLMKILKLIYDLNLPQCALASGSIRNTVWQVLSQQPVKPISDIDVVFFDPNRPKYDDQVIQTKLTKIAPEYIWQVKNEAYMHTYDFENAQPFTSVRDAISHFVETPTCIGAYLKVNNLKLITPYGVNDLVNLQCRPIPSFQKDNAHLAIYRERVQRKGWAQRWPLLTISDL